MSERIPEDADNWILDKGPCSDIVVSSRARLARNLPRLPFAPHAQPAQLAQVVQTIHDVLASRDYFRNFIRYEVASLAPNDRRYLRESHLISTELEKGRKHREVYLNTALGASVMVNEEDHLRIQAMMAGLRIAEVYERAETVEREMEKSVDFAYSPQFGYLAACPTNTGTGLRVSVMLHLVALVMTNQAEETLAPLGKIGLAVRGAYGEHSANVGDLFQISNEITLGKTEEDLIGLLEEAVKQVMEREAEARDALFKQAAAKCEDAIQRAVGILSFARSLDSNEASGLLSRLRLGVNRDFGYRISHEELNHLMIEIQPAHLLHLTPQASSSDEQRDAARAAYLRTRFRDGGSPGKN